MFFRKKKKAQAPAPSPPAPLPASDSSEQGDGPSTQFLTGESDRDQRSVQVLLAAIARVSEARDLESTLNELVDTSIDVTGAERGLLVFRTEDGELDVRVARRKGGEAFKEDLRFSTTVVKKVIENQEPLRTTVHSDSEALELGTSVFDLKLRAVMCVPLNVSREGEGQDVAPQRGVLYVDSKAATRDFTPEDLSLFAALSQHISIALLNARLNESSLEKVRLERSLEIASEIQDGLMPQIPDDVPGYDVHGWYRSAEETSGDFYDFVKVRGGGLAVIVGDVTGHGIGPALITTTAQASLRSYLRVLNDPSEVLSMLNQDLDERMDDGMFLTLFLGMIHDDGKIRLLNAGHTPPLVWRSATGKIDEIPGNGPALGMISEFNYDESTTIQLDPGDVLIAFTDGFVEARHPERPDDLFDDEGMRGVIEEHAPQGCTAQQLIEHLVEAVLAHSGGNREDDMTLVAVRRSP